MSSIIWLIPFFPLLGFLVNGLMGKRLSEKLSGILASISVGLSFMVGLFLFTQFLNTHEPIHQTLFSWLAVGRFEISITYLVDSLSLVMVLVVTGVGLLIHIYSIGYMKGDPGIHRYFAYLNLFMFMMLTLVMSENFVLLFLGWEGVGLCSYLLIGFWFEDREKAAAGKKAFIVSRIGDFGFLLAMFLLASKIGSLTFEDTLVKAAILKLSPETITTISLLLFLGAVGKSAQIPLYVWLPDAMAGPTPVSALIHAATMVTAGVYLIARCGILYAASPVAMIVVSTVGIVTAFFAATMAITENDIKKVLAYSTISQLGYMFTAVGVGAFAAGIFHLMTHAFFKALLFLGAGSVIHRLRGIQDMRNMGGLKGAMPKTYWTMLVGVCAIAGVPLLSGFFSKDEILWSAYSSEIGGNFLYVLGLITVVITAFYMFRIFFMTFHGNAKWDKDLKPHESPPVMTIPLIILAILAVTGGYIGIPESWGIHNFFFHFIEQTSPDAIFHPSDLLFSENLLMIFSIVAALTGIGLAFHFYVKDRTLPERTAIKLSAIHKLLSRKYYVDEIYNSLFVQPIRKGSEILWTSFDIRIIDGMANVSGRLMMRFGEQLRRLQTGVVQNYAAIFFLGVIFIIFYIYLT